MRTNAINILLADDDVKNSLLLKKFLEAENYVVSYAPDGLTAWEMYHRQHPDLILLDVNMPAMNGFELAQRIRETDNKVLIFFLTDRTEKADRLKGFSLKGNDYIPKPFYPEELIAKIAERFEQRKINAQYRYNIGIQTVAGIGDVQFDIVVFSDMPGVGRIGKNGQVVTCAAFIKRSGRRCKGNTILPHIILIAAAEQLVFCMSGAL